ncbi:hypothetical protein [Bombiscardovia coagulans]|uniref:Cell surface protein n=1 Tax=Bombiscardovia coagulans TaxID=686666 RepID=A0A261EUY7_9BIFI|nr:hypothetical protein [Bombiscardovia coagulans]OZG50681.1 hypothetical protein BOCO_0281 [Bombiscardovia coagulans]
MSLTYLSKHKYGKGLAATCACVALIFLGLSPKSAQAHVLPVDQQLSGINILTDGKAIDGFTYMKTNYQLVAKPKAIQVTNVPNGWLVENATASGNPQGGSAPNISASVDFHLNTQFSSDDLTELKTIVGQDFKPAVPAHQNDGTSPFVLQEFTLDKHTYPNLQLSHEQLSKLSFDRQELRASIQSLHQAGFGLGVHWYDIAGNEIDGIVHADQVHYVDISIIKGSGKDIRSLDYVFTMEKDNSVLVAAQMPQASVGGSDTWTLNPAAIGGNYTLIRLRPDLTVHLDAARRTIPSSFWAVPVTYTLAYAPNKIATVPQPVPTNPVPPKLIQQQQTDPKPAAPGLVDRKQGSSDAAQHLADVPTKTTELGQTQSGHGQSTLASTGSPIIAVVVISVVLAISAAYVLMARKKKTAHLPLQ